MIKIICYPWHSKTHDNYIAVKVWDGMSINKRWQYTNTSDHELLQDKDGHIYYKSSCTGDFVKWCNNFDLNAHLRYMYVRGVSNVRRVK